MLGVNFFKKNESPIAKATQSSKETPLFHEDSLDELQDSVNMWRVQNEIEMKKMGISLEIANMFGVDTEDLAASSDLNQKNHPLQPTEASNENAGTHPKKEIAPPQEILPQSENDLLLQVKNEYAASAFFDKTHDVLLKRGVSEENLPDAMEHIFTKMATKSIESFKGAITQVLNENGLDELDTENYIYWRLNEHTDDNIMYLVKDGDKEVLVAENFITDNLLDSFYKRAENIEGTPEELREADVVTSEKIDELLDDINNL